MDKKEEKNNNSYSNAPKFIKTPLFKILMGVMALLLCTVCGYLLIEKSHINPYNNDGYIETIGIITDYEYELKYDSDTGDEYYMYTSIAEYEVNGITYEVLSHSESNIEPLIGVKVAIMYNPENPQDAFFKPSYLEFIVVCIIIGILLLASFVFLIVGIKDAIKHRNS